MHRCWEYKTKKGGVGKKNLKDSQASSSRSSELVLVDFNFLTLHTFDICVVFPLSGLNIQSLPWSAAFNFKHRHRHVLDDSLLRQRRKDLRLRDDRNDFDFNYLPKHDNLYAEQALALFSLAQRVSSCSFRIEAGSRCIQGVHFDGEL